MQIFAFTIITNVSIVFGFRSKMSKQISKFLSKRHLENRKVLNFSVYRAFKMYGTVIQNNNVPCFLDMHRALSDEFFKITESRRLANLINITLKEI